MQLSELTENFRHCWRCSHCKWVHSPTSDEFAHACPSIQYGNFHSYSGGGKVVTAFALANDEATYTDSLRESVFACTMCGGCDVSCKINNGEMVEPLEVLYALRAKIAEDGESPAEHQTMVENLRREGNPFGRPRADRAAWADGLGIKDATKEQVDVLLHIGCDNSYTASNWAELKALINLLRQANVDFGIAYAQECASGEVAHDMGFRDDARSLAQNLAAIIANSRAQRVVTCSAGSFSAFRNVWPRLGVNFGGKRLQHITEFVLELFEAGGLTLKGKFDGTVTYHDPCKLGRLSEPYKAPSKDWVTVLNTMMVHPDNTPVLFGNDGLYEAPRKLLERIPGLRLVEMERNRVASYCCGAGGGASEAYPDFADFAARKRLREAKATGAPVVVTACGGCQHHLAGTAETDKSPVAVTGVFEFLAAASS